MTLKMGEWVTKQHYFVLFCLFEFFVLVLNIMLHMCMYMTCLLEWHAKNTWFSCDVHSCSTYVDNNACMHLQGWTNKVSWKIRKPYIHSLFSVIVLNISFNLLFWMNIYESNIKVVFIPFHSFSDSFTVLYCWLLPANHTNMIQKDPLFKNLSVKYQFTVSLVCNSTNAWLDWEC